MKSTGIIRTTDNLGRIVLPKELRKSFAITSETPLEIFTDDGRHRPAQVPSRRQLRFLRRSHRRHGGVPGMHICAACRRAISQL